MINAVILAAGEGKRMKSRKAKVVHKALGKEIVKWVADAARGAGTEKICVVVGHKEEQVRECLGESVEYAVQKEQKGTGHAVMMAEAFLEKNQGTVLVLCGDAPLIKEETLKKVIEEHKKKKNACTVISALIDCPDGYGRIVRDETGKFLSVTEHKDCTAGQLRIKECNAGMYCFEVKDLLPALKKINCCNNQNEYYITDVPAVMSKEGLGVDTYILEDKDEMFGINDRIQLAEATEILRERYVRKNMEAGVTFIKPDSCYVSPDAEIGEDTIIYPNCIIEGMTKIGPDCIIGPDSRISDAEIGRGTEINKSVIVESSIGNETKVGPFAYVRPGNRVGDHVKVGDFVELKKAEIGNGTKISHLTYIGDAQVGEDCNIACGVVTVNYDGSKKYLTKIGDNCFVGCNVNLVSPVEVESDSYIAAGSTITERVPSKALAIARARQVNKEGWVEKKGRYKRKK